MVKALSVDLRVRVVAAVAGGMSRNKAAGHFGVSIASAVRWCALERVQGDVTPKPQGGDRKSDRIEGQSELILAAIKASPDITLAELKALLHDKKHEFSITALWRFFDRHKITLKKSRPMRQSKSVQTF